MPLFGPWLRSDYRAQDCFIAHRDKLRRLSLITAKTRVAVESEAGTRSAERVLAQVEVVQDASALPRSNVRNALTGEVHAVPLSCLASKAIGEVMVFDYNR